MGRPITSPPLSREEISRGNLWFARGWIKWTLIVGICTLIFAVIDSLGGPVWLLLPYPLFLFAIVCLEIGCFVIWVAYAPRPTRPVLVASAILGLTWALITWDLRGLAGSVVTLLIFWTVFRVIFDLWFREEQVILEKKPRAIWPSRSE